MRRLLIAFLLPLAAVTPLHADDWSLPKITQQVLRLESASRDGDKGTCSAAIFTPGLALTAAHCVEGEEVDLTLDGRYATVLRSNRLLDLAVVKFTPRATDVVMPLGTAPDRGREVAIIGFAFAKRDPTATFGRVAVPKDEDGFLVLNADIIFGQSGCPVINRKGQLVAITSAIQSQGPAHLGLAVPVTTITEFIADLLPKATAPPAPAPAPKP